MASRLPAFPTIPRHRYTVTLGDERFQVRLTWRARTRAWYLDLFDADGDAVALGRRLSPGFGPLLHLLPAGKYEDGELYVSGALDPYRQEDLTSEINLDHYTNDDIDAARDRLVDDDNLAIEVS